MGYIQGVTVEHVHEGQLEYELDKCDELREPPVLAVALDEWHDVECSGWSVNPTALTTAGAAWWAAGDGSRPASKPRFLAWVRAHDNRPPAVVQLRSLASRTRD